GKAECLHRAIRDQCAGDRHQPGLSRQLRRARRAAIPGVQQPRLLSAEEAADYVSGEGSALSRQRPPQSPPEPAYPPIEELRNCRTAELPNFGRRSGISVYRQVSMYSWALCRLGWRQRRSGEFNSAIPQFGNQLLKAATTRSKSSSVAY